MSVPAARTIEVRGEPGYAVHVGPGALDHLARHGRSGRRVLLVAQPGLALPGSLGNYFFGPKLVRAEVLVKDGGVLHDYRVDRGTIRNKAGGTLTLLERDGSSRVVGEGSAYFLRIREKPSDLKPGSPASLPPIEIKAVAAGKMFDMQSSYFS